MEEKQKNQINIELTDEVAGGIYSNLAIITHSPTEFVLDFVSLMPGTPKAKVKSRIVMTPQHAKRLYKALADKEEKVIFGGRLAEYKYYDMAPVIEQVMKMKNTI